MGLNIKNERTHDLVRRLADLTGMSQTGAVEDAVRRRLEDLQSGRTDGRPAPAYSPDEVARRRAAVHRILDEFHAETTPAERAALVGAEDDLYDAQGLPR